MSDSFDPYYEWLGIPAEDQPPTHYRLLGITQLETNPTVIENATDRQMRYLRSFQNGPRGNVSQILLNEVARARYILLDEQSRLDYDRSLTDTESSPATISPPTVTVAATTTTEAMPSDAAPPVVTAPVATAASVRTASRSPVGRGRFPTWMISLVTMPLMVIIWYQFVYLPKQKEQSRETVEVGGDSSDNEGSAGSETNGGDNSGRNDDGRNQRPPPCRSFSQWIGGFRHRDRRRSCEVRTT